MKPIVLYELSQDEALAAFTVTLGALGGAAGLLIITILLYTYI